MLGEQYLQLLKNRGGKSARKTKEKMGGAEGKVATGLNAYK